MMITDLAFYYNNETPEEFAKMFLKVFNDEAYNLITFPPPVEDDGTTNIIRARWATEGELNEVENMDPYIFIGEIEARIENAINEISDEATPDLLDAEMWQKIRDITIYKVANGTI